MAASDAQKRATIKYDKENYIRIVARLRKDDKERLDKHLLAHNYSINGFVNEAILEKIQRESNINNPPDPEETEAERSERIAKTVGFNSGEEFELASLIVKTVDRLKEIDRNSEAVSLTDLLNNSPNSIKGFWEQVEKSNFGSDMDSTIQILLDFHKLRLANEPKEGKQP